MTTTESKSPQDTTTTGGDILWQWTSHTDASYHDFSQGEASQIREALLVWYRQNRRKLPWRGDPPPFSSATSVMTNKKTKANKVSYKTKGQQQSIQSFFEPKKPQNDDPRERLKSGAPAGSDETVMGAEGKAEALPVTGYGVWVSEIMLQQTRVEAVIPYYLKWMKSFPTVHDLANATEEEVNSHWAGLGFYRRARLLHRGAKKVVDEMEGELPETVEELLKIDGIGRYTASAIASIAFQQCVPVVDGNVCRVLSRLRGIANHIKSPVLKDDLGWKLAQQIVGEGHQNAGDINQALMELGATYCSPSGNGLDSNDPLKEFYLSTRLSKSFMKKRHELSLQGSSFSVEKYMEEVRADNVSGDCCKLCDENGIQDVLEAFHQEIPDGHGPFPLAPPKAGKREEILAVGAVSVSVEGTKRWLLVKRPSTGLLAGQWEFPSACVWTSGKNKTSSVPFVEAKIRNEALTELLDNCMTSTGMDDSRPRRVLSEPIEHVFSHVRHTMWIEMSQIEANDITEPMEWKSKSGQNVRWMTEEDMKKVGVTSGVKKVLSAVKRATTPSRNQKRKRTK